MSLVHKFGGTSVRDADRLRQVVQNLKHHHQAGDSFAVITSAAAGMTDLLVGIKTATDWQVNIAGIGARHSLMAETLLSGNARSEYLVFLENELAKFPGDDPAGLALVSCLGERLMAPLLASCLAEAGFPAKVVDSSKLIRTDDQFHSAQVDFETTRQLVSDELAEQMGRIVPVMAGFVGSTKKHQTTLLGRNGSDYSASLIGAALQVDEVWIWTDVDGLYTADPRFHQSASLLSQVSFREAAEAAYFGAKVVHPFTMWPLLECETNLRIKNTMAPGNPGTLICHHPNARGEKLMTTAISDVCVITVGGYGLVGVPGVASRLFGVIANCGTNVLMISQSSSEHNITFVIRGEDVERTQQALQENLADWMGLQHKIERIRVQDQAAILTIVGENMRGRVGVAGHIFSALGDANVNVIAIAQGSSEYSISVVIDQAAVRRATDAILEKVGNT